MFISHKPANVDGIPCPTMEEMQQTIKKSKMLHIRNTTTEYIQTVTSKYINLHGPALVVQDLQ